MLKHYCKLVAYTGAFPPSALHDLYHNYICRLYPQNGTSTDTPNYARHILDIKSLLFSTARRASVSMTLNTNIKVKEPMKIGSFIQTIFSLAKHGGAFCDNDVEVILRHNSPFQATVHISGQAEQLLEVFSALLTFSGIDSSEKLYLPMISQVVNMLPEYTGNDANLSVLAHTYRQQLSDIGIEVYMLEYYVDNFEQYIEGCGSVYYFNVKSIPAANYALTDS